MKCTRVHAESRWATSGDWEASVISQSKCTDWNAICRRAGGRRRYSQVRRIQAELRLTRVPRLLMEVGHRYGYQASAAKRLCVSRSTVCGDIARLYRRFCGGRAAEEEHRADERMHRHVPTIGIV